MLSNIYQRLIGTSIVRQNTIANFVGRIAAALISFIFIPFYIRFLGVESYGLVGFYISFQAILGLSDIGLSSTLNREFARYSAIPDQGQAMRDLLKTMHIIYWGMTLLVCGIVILLAPLIANQWLNTGSLDPGSVQNAVILMGFMGALQGPFSLYIGGLLGLQRHVTSNLIYVGTALVRSGGVVLILWFISPTITTFFGFQLVVTLLGALIAGVILWRALPITRISASFRTSLLRNVWRFAAGMSASAVLWMLLSQFDKIVLSKLLPLDRLGYYTLAGAVSGALVYLSAPLYNSIFPQFTKLIVAQDEMRLKSLYHTSSQLMAVLVCPVATILALSSHDVLLLWTHNVEVADNAYVLLILLVVGTTLNLLLTTSYGLLVAAGQIRFNVLISIVSIICYVPMLLILVNNFGAVGAGIAWILLNLGTFIPSAWMAHSRILHGEARKWYVGIIVPIIVIQMIGWASKILIPDLSGFALVIFIGLSWFLMTAGGIVAAPEMRRLIRAMLRLGMADSVQVV